MSEIGSCIFNYLKDVVWQYVGNSIDVVLYSNNCCGQNKNKLITTINLHAAHNLNNLQSKSYN